MGDGGEAVLACCPGGPAFDCGFGDFHGVTAVAADQVVVVFLAVAAPVPVLALLAAEHVHLTVAGHGLQEPVDRGQGDRFALIAEHGVQLLGAAEPCVPPQQLLQGRTLPGPPFHS